MKVLFAVSNDNITKGVISKYQRMYKEIITSKNVYYFNAIVNELQRDKSYDAIIVSEDLEPISNNNFEAIDNFLVEKLDNISDEASKPTGEDIPIIFICSDRRTKSDVLLRKFFSMSIYNALVGNDRNLDQLCNLLNKPRNKKEAKKYYNIDSEGEIEYKPSTNDLVSEDQIRNILNYYGRIGNNEKKCVEAFNSIANQYDDTQLRIIVKFLPMPVKAILETSCQRYQELMSNGTVLSNGKYVKYKNNETEKQKKHGFLDFMEKDISKEKMDKPVIIPSAMNIAKPIQENNNGMNMSQEPVRPTPMQNVQQIQHIQPVQPIQNIQPTQPMQQFAQQPKMAQNPKAIQNIQPVQPINHIEPVQPMEPIKPIEPITQQPVYNEPDMQQSPYLGEQYNQPSYAQPMKPIDDNVKPAINNLSENHLEENDEASNNTRKNELAQNSETDTMNTQDSAVVEPEETEQKRGRGRPRKYPISTEPKVKKKRGRPRKNPLPDEIETTEQPMQKDSSIAQVASNANTVQSINAGSVKNTNQNSSVNNAYSNTNKNTTEIKNNSEDKNAQEGEKNNMFDDQETNLFDMNLGTNNNQNYQGNNPMYNQNQANNYGYNNNMNYNFDNNYGFDNNFNQNGLEMNQNIQGLDNQNMNNPYDSFNNFNANSNPYGDMGMNQPNMNYNDNQFNGNMINTNPSMNQPMNNIAKKEKVALFVGTTKNGTSFIVNNLAQMLSENNIKTAIVDLTRNKNAYYMFTNNDSTKMKIAGESLKNLSKGVISGIEYNKNLTIFTELPGEAEIEPIDENAVIANAESNFDVVLLDCDFTTKQRYFALASEIYLVQTMDAFTIQPLTKFLSDLKANNLLDETKLRVVINKYVKLKMLDYKMIIGGMSKYNEPSMTLQRDLFNANAIKYVLIPFEENAYEKYLEEIAMCQLSLDGFSKELVDAFTKLKEIVYPLVAGDGTQENNGGYNNFNNYNNTLNQNINSYGANQYNQYGNMNASYGNNNYYGNMGQVAPQYGQYNNNQFSNAPINPNVNQEKKKKRGLFGRKKEEETIPNNNQQINQTFSNNMNDTLNKMRNNY